MINGKNLNAACDETMADLPLFKVALNFKAPGTSARAASAASKYSGKTFVAILDALRQRPMTPDEVARATGISLLTARPRMSDLACPRDPVTHKRIAPFIAKTGIERATECGKSAAVMRVLTDEERAAWKPSDVIGEAT